MSNLYLEFQKNLKIVKEKEALVLTSLSLLYKVHIKFFAKILKKDVQGQNWILSDIVFKIKISPD